MPILDAKNTTHDLEKSERENEVPIFDTSRHIFSGWIFYDSLLIPIENMYVWYPYWKYE